MTPGGDAYRAGSFPGRVTAFFFILGAHLAFVAAIALLGGPAAVVQHAKPLFVQFVPRPVAAPAPPAPRVPLPALRRPDIVIPSPPAIDTLSMQPQERPAAPAPVMASAVSAAEPSPARAPAQPLEPPRFDLAYLNNPAPAYPPLSRRLREEGRVVLRVLVSPDGLVESLEVMTTSGHARLDETALAAVRRWRFVPARAGERAVAGWAIVPVAFHLDS